MREDVGVGGVTMAGEDIRVRSVTMAGEDVGVGGVAVLRKGRVMGFFSIMVRQRGCREEHCHACQQGQ